MSCPFLNTAFAIGADLCREAVWWEDRCNWIGDEVEAARGNGGRKKYGAAALSADVYGGTIGMALFLAPLSRATGEEYFREHATGAARNALRHADQLKEHNPHGFYNGATGLAYGLIVVGRILEIAEFVSGGRDLIEAIAATEEPSRHIDVIAGPAGTLLALDSLANDHEFEFPDAFARALADQLLASVTESDRGLSWTTLPDKGGPDLVGFAHGVSGIIGSLAVTNERFNDSAIAAAVAGGLRYERSWFVPESGNWPDLRRSPTETAGVPKFMNAWCHGAPGIALTRLKLSRLSSDPTILDEATIALRTTADAADKLIAANTGNYSLCHGLAGNGDILLGATGVPEEARYRQLAYQVGEHGIDRFGTGKPPWPSGLSGSQYVPSFMQGLAGTGHFYLRLHSPDTTPSLLATGLA